MKFAYFANIRLPSERAHSIQIMKMCEAIAKQSIEIELLIPRRWNRIQGDPYHFYGIKKNFGIMRLWCLDLLPLLFFKKPAFWIESMSFAFAAMAHAAMRDYSVYYTRDMLIAVFLSALRAPLFYELHTIPERGRFIHHFAWRKSAGLIVISGGIRDELIRAGIPASKILVARDAVDFDQFNIALSKRECRQKLQLPQASKIVAYTGHLYAWKGVRVLAEAVSMLPSGIEAYLVGGTSDDVLRFKEKYQFPNLHVVGWQDPGQVPLWLRAVDLLVLPNSAREKIGALYTSPLKLFEYMASGTPMIAADLPAVREIIDDSHAIFFDPDDSRMLAEKILEGFENYADRVERARAAQTEAKKYSWENRARETLLFMRRYL